MNELLLFVMGGIVWYLIFEIRSKSKQTAFEANVINEKVNLLLRQNRVADRFASNLLQTSDVEPIKREMVWEKTGKEMVFVPAGRFLYGNELLYGSKESEVYLDAFWIDKTPVTNADYKRFLDANPRYPVPTVFGAYKKHRWDKKRRMYPEGKADHPVVLVDWYDAQAYAEWAGAQLPTEKQWEKAARGTDGRAFPWGNDWRDAHCNSSNEKIKGTSSVSQFSPKGDSPYGCVDMVGNVSEWTMSKLGKGSDLFTLRGGGWNLSIFPTYRVFPGNPKVRRDWIGFRLVVPHPIIPNYCD